MNPPPAFRPIGALSGAAVIFDLDGTLVDTAPDLVGALNALLGEQNLPALPLEQARVMVGRGARALIEQGFAAEGQPLSAEETPVLVERFITLYRARIADQSRPFDGVIDALDVPTRTGSPLLPVPQEAR